MDQNDRLATLANHYASNLQRFQELVASDDIRTVTASFDPTHEIALAATPIAAEFLKKIGQPWKEIFGEEYKLGNHQQTFALDYLASHLGLSESPQKSLLFAGKQPILHRNFDYPPLTKSYGALMDEFANLVRAGDIKAISGPRSLREIVATEKGKAFFDTLGLKQQLTLHHPALGENRYFLHAQEFYNYCNMHASAEYKGAHYHAILQLQPQIQDDELRELIFNAWQVIAGYLPLSVLPGAADVAPPIKEESSNTFPQDELQEEHRYKIDLLKSFIASGDIKLLTAPENPETVSRLAVTADAQKLMQILDILPTKAPDTHYALGENTLIYSKFSLIDNFLYNAPPDRLMDVTEALDGATAIHASHAQRHPVPSSYADQLAEFCALVASQDIKAVLSVETPRHVVRLAATPKGSLYLGKFNLTRENPPEGLYTLGKHQDFFPVTPLVSEFLQLAPLGKFSEIGTVLSHASTLAPNLGLNPEQVTQAHLSNGLRALDGLTLDGYGPRLRLRTHHVVITSITKDAMVNVRWPDREVATLIGCLVPEEKKRVHHNQHSYDAAALAEAINKLAEMIDSGKGIDGNSPHSALRKLGQVHQPAQGRV